MRAQIELPIPLRIMIYSLLFLSVGILILNGCRVRAMRLELDRENPKEVIEKEIEVALMEPYQLIDYVQNGDQLYALVSRKGITNYGDCFQIYERDSTGMWNWSYENDFKNLKPWKLAIADIDGDGKIEIAIGVKKTTDFDAEEKNRFFVFRYMEDILVKVWTGSQIAGTWRDFTIGNLVDIPGEEVIFTRATDQGGERVSIYHWFDFGFFLLAESEEYEEIVEVSIAGDNCLDITYMVGKRQKETVLKIASNKLVEEQ